MFARAARSQKPRSYRRPRPRDKGCGDPGRPMVNAVGRVFARRARRRRLELHGVTERSWAGQRHLGPAPGGWSLHAFRIRRCRSAAMRVNAAVTGVRDGVSTTGQDRYPERVRLTPRRTTTRRGAGHASRRLRRHAGPQRGAAPGGVGRRACSSRSTPAGSSLSSPSAPPRTAPRPSPATSPPPTAGSPWCPTRPARSPRP